MASQVLTAVEAKDGVLLAEVRLESRVMRDLAIKSGDVSSLMSAVDSAMNVRIVLPTGIGFASSNRMSKAEGIRLVQAAYKQARGCDWKAPVHFSSEPTVKTSWEVQQKKPLADVGTEERLKFMRGLDSAVLKTKVKVQGRFYVVRDWEISEYFANSEGSRVRSFLPRVMIESANVVSSRGETEQSIREWGGTGGWEVLERLELDRVLPAEVKMLRTQIEKGRKVKPGVCDLVCGPEVAGIAAHESCGHPMEADRILGREMSQAGKSFVTPEHIGQAIGSGYATVIDDPTIPGSYGYYAYDMEGVKARPRYLYRNGKINELLHNRETAGRLGLHSNGSSRSETCLREPIVRMANTYVAPGDFEDDELVGAVKNGVLMHSFTEWNIDDKRFNQKYVSREAYFVEDGEVAGPARKCVLEITTPGFWGAVDASSKHVDHSAGECGKGDPMQGVPAFLGGPFLRLRGVMLK